MKKNIFITLIAILGLSSCATKHAISIEGENLSALTQVTDNEEPCITPSGGDDGKNLFYAAKENKYFYNIYKKDNAFSSSVAQKTSGNNMNYSPTYSATTDKIVFRCQNEGNNTSDIYMMSGTKGKALRQITDTQNGFEGNPSISKDGKYIAYDKQSYSYATTSSFVNILGTNALIIEKSEIWVKNLETGETTLLGNGYQPSFSPDGSKIAYVKYAPDAKSCCIWTMEIDGSNQVQLTDAKNGFASKPCWSPDGKQIAFEATNKNKKDTDIYIIDIDGDNMIQLTKNKSIDMHPHWTTDGYIYFTSDRGNKKGNYQIWRFKVEE